ncbi:nucleotidyltransferase domain-containing protein [Peribacillus simplex]|uniref:nucleotidyltransferase domain-containing protein n=1 Tax=Peribacillus simplex TaxID=1478 RepID=UPI0024BFA598|nr:nucleotidyltransferase domain-containing protein [Peribacillus simplex]WHY95705.1 nucleotidyltransferase domain-containing protein [Peribacillus simplex]
MKENLISRLRYLEKKEDMTILMAAVTGSHSFGLSSGQSDYDVRFIYVHNDKRSYLSLSQPVEVIQMKEDLFDMEGWDLFKSSRLTLKSNPALFELFQSRIKLITHPDYYRKMKGLIAECYSKKALGHHYYRMMSDNLQLLAKTRGSERKELKTWVQVYRSYLILEYIIQRGSLPPISVWELLDLVSIDQELKTTITRIFKAKQMEEYISNNQSEKNFSIIEGKSLSLKNEITRLHQGKKMETELNELIWTILK